MIGSDLPQSKVRNEPNKEQVQSMDPAKRLGLTVRSILTGLLLIMASELSRVMTFQIYIESNAQTVRQLLMRENALRILRRVDAEFA